MFVLLRGRHWWLAFIALLIFLAILLALYPAVVGKGSLDGVMINKSDLEPGKEYFWNVVVEDDDGAVVHSELRRFEVE